MFADCYYHSDRRQYRSTTNCMKWTINHHWEISDRPRSSSPMIRPQENSISPRVVSLDNFHAASFSPPRNFLPRARTQLYYSISRRNLARHKCEAIKRDVKLTAVYVTLFTWNYRWFLPRPPGEKMFNEKFINYGCFFSDPLLKAKIFSGGERALERC